MRSKARRNNSISLSFPKTVTTSKLRLLKSKTLRLLSKTTIQEEAARLVKSKRSMTNRVKWRLKQRMRLTIQMKSSG